MKISKYRERVQQLFHRMDESGEWMDSNQIAEFFGVNYEAARSVIEATNRYGVFDRKVMREGGERRTFYRLKHELDQTIALFQGRPLQQEVVIDAEHEQWMQQHRQRFVERYQRIHGRLPNFL
jgi:3-deoxy-D-arabino-heptulosonate 7-phosphate (DAHP) synthase